MKEANKLSFLQSGIDFVNQNEKIIFTQLPTPLSEFQPQPKKPLDTEPISMKALSSHKKDDRLLRNEIYQAYLSQINKGKYPKNSRVSKKQVIPLKDSHD